MRPYPNPPESASPGDLPEPEYTPEGIPIPAFTPWRAKRERSGGWSPTTQRAFIHELTRIGSVGAAAKAVGKTSRSAYQLREKDGAESFAAAWEAAKFAGRDHSAQIAIERALYGEMVPTFRDGQFTGYKVIHNDRMLMAAIRAEDNRADPDNLAQLESWKRRLEKWEIALRRQAMDLADGTAASRSANDDAREDNIVWQREMKREERRQRNAEIRAAVRKGMTPPPPPEPRVRIL
jgi:hypothetical protein